MNSAFRRKLIKRPSQKQDLQVQPSRPALWPGEFQPLTGTEIVTTSDIESAIEPSVVCLKCKVIRAWLGKHRPSHHRETEDDSKGAEATIIKEFKHHSTGTQLERSSARGCHLCTLIWQSILEDDRYAQTKTSLRGRQARLAKARKGKDLRVVLFYSATNMYLGANVDCDSKTRARTSERFTIPSRRNRIARWPGKIPPSFL